MSNIHRPNYYRDYYAATRDRRRAYAAAYRQANREGLNMMARFYYKMKAAAEGRTVREYSRS